MARQPRPFQRALRTAAIYVVVSALWIALSDAAVSFVTTDPGERLFMQTVKGLAFVIVSGLFVGFLVLRELRGVAESQGLLEAMTEQNVAGLYVIHRGRLVSGNARLSRILGYSLEELARRPIWEFVAESDRERSRRRLTPAESDSPRELPPVRLTLQHKDGGLVRAELHSRRIAWDESSAIAGIMIDVTEEERRIERREHSQKLEILGQLTGAVAHDFKNLLTAIIAPLDHCRAQLEAAHPARKEVDEAYGAASRAASLTRQLLAFSRQRPYSPVTVDLNEILRRDDTILRHAVGREVRIEFALQDELPLVEVDPFLIGHALLNLVVNASEAMDGRGLVRISTGLGADTDGSPRVVLEVSDEGPGIPQPVLEHLFEPFFTTKQEGTGLGLATVHRIVSQAGGSVSAESEPGKGSVFRIHLPLDGTDRDGVGLEPAGLATAAERAWLPSATILVVEDEDAIRSVTDRILSRHGFEVLVAPDAATGRQVAEKHGEAIDLLLCDVGLPDGDGYELAGELANRISGLRVIVTSGHLQIHDPEPKSSGFFFLEKPFAASDLVESVRTALEARGGDPGRQTGTHPHRKGVF